MHHGSYYGQSISAHQKIASILVPITGTFAYFTLQQSLLKVGFNLKYFSALQALMVLGLLIAFYKKTNKTLIT